MNDPGPYVEGDDGPRVWVPRTVPYREAWAVAREAVEEFDQRIRYVRKENAALIGFARDCPCEEVCERIERNAGDRSCDVPARLFTIEERP